MHLDPLDQGTRTRLLPPPLHLIKLPGRTLCQQFFCSYFVPFLNASTCFPSTRLKITTRLRAPPCPSARPLSSRRPKKTKKNTRLHSFSLSHTQKKINPQWFLEYASRTIQAKSRAQATSRGTLSAPARGASTGSASKRLDGRASLLPRS